MSVLKGYAKWAFITKPNTKYEATYIINVVVTEEIAKVFREKGHLVKQEPEGPAIVVQRKVNGPNGIVRPAPKLLNIKIGRAHV